MIEFLLLSYGLTFGLTNKLPSKVYEVPPVEVGEHPEPIWVRLLRCSYCVGFWSGIFAYLLLCMGGMEHWPSSGGWFRIPAYGLMGAGWCYALDSLLRLAEYFVEGDEEEEDLD